MFGCGIPIFFQEVATGQYLGSGGLTMIGQLVPMLQGTYVTKGIRIVMPELKLIEVKSMLVFYFNHQLFFRCWLCHNDDRVFPRHLLLHHYLLDFVLPYQ